MKRTLSFTVIALMAMQVALGQAAPVFSTKGKAIKGYDPVAFFLQKAAIKGFDSLTYSWNSANWYFSSQENLTKFTQQPEKYAPQYGGYCAYGCSQGHKAPTETDTWTIVDDKLYFNYNANVKGLWFNKKEKLIIAADSVWKVLKDKE